MCESPSGGTPRSPGSLSPARQEGAGARSSRPCPPAPLPMPPAERQRNPRSVGILMELPKFSGFFINSVETPSRAGITSVGGRGGLYVTRNFLLHKDDLTGWIWEPLRSGIPRSLYLKSPAAGRHRSFPLTRPLRRDLQPPWLFQAKAAENLQFFSRSSLSARSNLISLCIVAVSGAEERPRPGRAPAPDPRTPLGLTWWARGRVPPRSGSSPRTGKVSG